MKPTARELVGAIERGELLSSQGPMPDEMLAARVEKVLALHREGQTFGRHYCLNCGADWPCPTVRLLNGEDA